MTKHKLLLATVFLGISTSIFADTSGAYVGTSLGITHGKTELSVLNNNNNYEISKDDRTNDFMATVFLGYGARVKDKFYLGGEIGTLLTKSKFLIDRPGALYSEQFVDHLSIQNYLSTDLIPGYQVNDKTLIYGRIGASYSRLELFQPSPAANIPVISDEQNKIGRRLGIGIDYSLNQNFSLGADYIYTYYPAFSYTAMPYNVNFNFQPNTNQFGVHLKYKFN